MPLNVRSFCTSVLLVLFAFITFTFSQQTGPTSGDVMRDRISKAKAYIAVRNYNAAIYELENIRRETGDATVQGVVNVLLMNSYLEQGDYARAEAFLNEFFNIQKTTSPNASAFYTAVAGQVISGARNRVERYRSLGLSVSDRSLPLEAANDLEKMRGLLEIVIDQAKETAKDPKKTEDAIALVEEASRSRSMLARDDYDARRWRETVADTREEMTQSRSTVINAIVPPSSAVPGGELVAASTKPAEEQAKTPPILLPVNGPGSTAVRDREVTAPDSEPQKDQAASPAEKKPADTDTKKADARKDKPIVVSSAPPTEKSPDGQSEAVNKEPAPADNTPMEVGSLISYATRQTQPVYPSIARSTRTTGVVRVEVTVDESGEVTEVQNTSGPMLLQAAARDAILKWKFRPFVRDGQPVKAVGYVAFNFNL